MPKHVAGPRSDFAFEFDYCFVCNKSWHRDRDVPFTLEVHEIARGPARKKAVESRCAWLLLCRRCHDAMGDLKKWPISRQLALKRIHDPEYYSRITVNSLRGRDPNAITETEVRREMRRLLEEYPWMR